MPNVIPGGFLGVPIFLLISGYFVTMQLTAEYDQTGKMNVLHFTISGLKSYTQR